MGCFLESRVVLAGAVITKHHRLGDSNSRHLFLTVLEAGKSEVRVAAWLGSGGNRVLDLMAAFLL